VRQGNSANNVSQFAGPSAGFATNPSAGFATNASAAPSGAFSFGKKAPALGAIGEPSAVSQPHPQPQFAGPATHLNVPATQFTGPAPGFGSQAASAGASATAFSFGRNGGAEQGEPSEFPLNHVECSLNRVDYSLNYVECSLS
jgi:hypothetical protein